MRIDTSLPPFPTDYRASGVLLHVTSLPSPHGVGDVGPAALEWVDRLHEAGQGWWQALPLGPTGYGDSPYQPQSSFAGNVLLISPDWWLTANVTRVDLAGRRVGYAAAGGGHAALDWDHLVLACGSRVDVNLVPGAAAYAYLLKTLGDAIALGNDLIVRLEEASAAVDPRARERLLSVSQSGRVEPLAFRRGRRHAAQSSSSAADSAASRSPARSRRSWSAPVGSIPSSGAARRGSRCSRSRTG